MNKYLIPFTVFLIFYSGCLNEPEEKIVPNRPPKTYFWIYPDSTISEGNSKQLIRWWGFDPDGIIIGYLFAYDTIPITQATTWRWTVKTDTQIAFPLWKKRDTFYIAIRAVDNTFQRDVVMPEHAAVKLALPPYWDRNENGQFDDTLDILLPSLLHSMDPIGAFETIPVLNQPPSIRWAFNPNDPSQEMQQPETTFTVATFAWIGSDPDGDHTIGQYEIALNDTSPSRWVILKSHIRMISLVVPRSRSDTAVGEVAADLYTGFFKPRPHRLDTLKIEGLRLDDYNVLYIRARDVADSASSIISMPASPTRKWYVKKPKGKLLIIPDIDNSVWRTTTIGFYRSILPQVENPAGEKPFEVFDIFDIGRDLTPAQKQQNIISSLVPPFIDPAFIFTLHLFDIVIWFTDAYPSLGVAHVPLRQYTNDVIHPGKVIFSTTFEISVDPRGAIVDFAPIDSVSSIDLVKLTWFGERQFPSLGDTRIPAGFFVYPDSSDPRNIYPTLQFNTLPSRHVLFMRPIYPKADSRAIYYIQDDTRRPIRYTNLVTYSELKSVSSISSHAWACGAVGSIFYTSNNGRTWVNQVSGTTDTLNSICFVDSMNGWIVGNSGSVLITRDGGSTWSFNRAILPFYHLTDVEFFTVNQGAAIGTSGLIVYSANGGNTWTSAFSGTRRKLWSIDFNSVGEGIVVGDSGTILRTSDGGVTWEIIPSRTLRHLKAVHFRDNQNVVAVGSSGIIMMSSDGGKTWAIKPTFTNLELRSVFFINNLVGFTSGLAGTLFKTVDGGENWFSLNCGSNQHINGVSYSDERNGWLVGTGGVIIYTDDGGSSWTFQPKGKITVGVIDGDKKFVFLGLPLHVLNGDGTRVKPFLEHVIFKEFGYSNNR